MSLVAGHWRESHMRPSSGQRSARGTWFAEVNHAEWTSFADVKAAYRSADVVAGNRVVFNIGVEIKYHVVDKNRI